MGFSNGRWVVVTAPNQIDYPFEIAAKLLRDSKGCNHDEVCELVTTTRRFYELCKEQDTTIRRLEKELTIASATVRMLQVSDT